MKNKIKSYLVSFILTFFLFGCAGSIELDPDVCEIGFVVFEVSENLCDALPVPTEICFYVRLASLNFDILCSADPESNEYKKAKTEFIKWCFHINNSLSSRSGINLLLDSLAVNNEW